MYLDRLVDPILAEHLEAIGAVQVKGPKWCGKTETSLQHAKSVVRMQDPDESKSLVELAHTKPSLLLEGNTPRLIDEWQVVPRLWDAVRHAVDRRKLPGQFILTGSSTPTERPAHSGVGRISRIVMRTMTLLESGESTGAVSLGHLFDGATDVGALSDIQIDDIARLLCRGGWPAAVTAATQNAAMRLAPLYVEELIDSDVSRLDDVGRNATRMQALMRSYARHVATQASQATIAADMTSSDATASPKTVVDYLDALARAYVIEDLPAWNPVLRSKTAIRTSPTRHFTDPSIAAALLRATPAKLLEDFETFSLLFESLAVRDLRVYTQAIDGSVFHYRDKIGLEADAVLSLADGRWALVEVKLGERYIDDAAAHLRKLADRVDTKRMGPPSFLMVVTGGKAAYRRDDGVVVVPLACLKP